jgi:hypothetical protein
VKWFVAHIVMVVRFADGIQTSYPVWENVVLYMAESHEEVWDKAAATGRQGEGDDSGSMIWDDRPARFEFAGVRKVNEVIRVGDSEGADITDGDEVTYSQFVLPDAAALENLVAGDVVCAVYEI